MERIVFIVEGDCEVYFVKNKIIPYLYNFWKSRNPLVMNPQKITTNRRLNRKGGIVSFEYLKNEIGRIRAQGDPWITTFLDFFRLPADFPSFSTDSSAIERIESSLFSEIAYERLIPYIQKHEFEALMFAGTDAFLNINLTDKQFKAISRISDGFPNVEDINGGQKTAPSKRLEYIFDYKKTLHSQLVLNDIEIETIMERSPRFKDWIESLVKIVEGI